MTLRNFLNASIYPGSIGNTVERFKVACLVKLTWDGSLFQILNKCTINATFSEVAMIRGAYEGKLIHFLVK